MSGMSTTVTTQAAATLSAAFAEAVARHRDRLAVRDREATVSLTWRELDLVARRAASGLAALGVRRGGTVGLLLDNRPEFHISDLAAVMLGAVPVSIYSTSAPEQIAYIARDAGLEVVITEAGHLETVRTALSGTDCRVVLPEELLAHEPLAEVVDADPEDLLTIIYTSGTTGPPKGVELTHRALLTATRTIGSVNGLAVGGRVICWLPLAHIAERIASHYAAVVFGLEVTTCADARAIGTVLREVRPTWFFAVPRIWEKLRATAQAAGLEGAAARAALGLDAVQAANIGAAPSAPEVIEFFEGIGVPLAEIYGMSENAACCTCNPRDAIRIGTVGPALPGVELRLAEDGEVLMRSDTLMRGYRNRPADTAAAIDAGGWLHTGDIGSLDGDGYLRIVDRKKELIINAAGKNMSPANIEAAIKAHSGLIAQICVIGDRRPYNVALVTLDADALAGRDATALDVLAEVKRAVDAGNARLSRVEQIKRFTVLDGAWVPGGDELTPTHKLRRAPIADKYAPEIDALYAGGTS
jgi:long-subunit acyl-CoA synthetase (AMP-forming)